MCFDSHIFEFFLLKCTAYVALAEKGENECLVCMRDPSYNYLEEIKMIHTVVRRREC